MNAVAQLAAILALATSAFAAVDPMTAAQVIAAAERTFPNLAAELDAAKLFGEVRDDPRLRGNLRGRLAEADWIARNAKDGWRSVANPNAPQYDAYRWNNARLEGAQVKVHAKPYQYLRAMEEDFLAKRFVIPDDQFDEVTRELEKRRVGALPGGLSEKAAHYGRQQRRLVKMGRTLAELDGAIDLAARHYARIASAMRAAGRAASFVAITLGILDGGIAVFELATGRTGVEEAVLRVSRAGVAGVASWAAGDCAAAIAIAAGASGAVPIAVAVVVGAAAYFVVDWAAGQVADGLRSARLTADDLARIWPPGSRGVPLDSIRGVSLDTLRGVSLAPLRGVSLEAARGVRRYR